MKIRKYLTGVSLFLVLCGVASLAVADDQWSDDWKIEVKGRATSAGTISFELTYMPGEDGTAADSVSLDALVADGAKDSDIAEVITNNFEALLGKDAFKINQSWGENVTIKARGDTPDFALAMTSSSVLGISIEIND